jgi:hypothetical protein
LSLLDPLADGHFLVRLQQLPSSDVLEVDTYQVDVLSTDSRFEALFFLLVLLLLLELGFVHMLMDERFRFIVFEHPLWRAERNRFLVFMLGDSEPELLGAMMPVENVRLPRRVVPLDQRFPPASGLEGERLSGSFLGHVIQVCKLVACEAEADQA